MMQQFSGLAFTPLKIQKPSIDISRLMNFIYQNASPHFPYPALWDALTFCGDIDSFDDPVECDKAWNSRYSADLNKIKLNPIFPDNLQRIIQDLIGSLPYDFCSFAQFLIQKVDIPPHQDGLYDKKNNTRMALQETPYGFINQPEPSGLKIILTESDSKCFYVSKRVKGKRTYVEMPRDTISFAINERTFFHGSKKPDCKKIILSTFGIIDRDKHESLLKTSLDYYEKHSIWL